MNKPVRDASRANFATEGDAPTWQEIRDGALLRIADAVEKVAQRHDSLINEKEMYKRFYENEMNRRRLAERRIAALQGVITRMRKMRKAAGGGAQ